MKKIHEGKMLIKTFRNGNENVLIAFWNRVLYQ